MDRKKKEFLIINEQPLAQAGEKTGEKNDGVRRDDKTTNIKFN